MKITSKLALNQLVRNRKRTMFTCLAVVLSTALITAVMCFATSTVDMLKRILGEDLSEYGGVYNAMIFIPALILTGLIVFMSVTVISNIFQASAADRISELGVLKCVGGTKKQIRKTVLCEGLWIGAVGIPAGLLAGVILGYLSVWITGLYIDRIAEITRSIVMRRFDIELSFSVRAYGFLLSAVFALTTILLSALKPAKKMSGITAVECVSFGGMRKEKTGKIKGNRLWKALWGFEGELGVRNISRKKSSFKPAIRALSTGICLLLSTAGLALQFGDIESYMRSSHNRLLIDYTSLRDEKENPVTGRCENTILHPIGPETYNGITDELNAYGSFEVWGIGSNRDTYSAKADLSFFTDDMKERKEAVNELGEMDFDMVSLSDGLYRKLCEDTGTAYGGNILINTYTFNDRGVMKEITPFTEDLRAFTLVTPAGETSEMQVDGFLDREDTDEWLFDPLNRAAVMLIVPGAEARYFDWYCEPGDEEEDFIAYARSVTEKRFPVLTDDSYADQGYSVRISREDTMVRAMNVMLILGEVILYAFVILLTLMGFAGFVSTVTANIRARSREFAVLKSVGMTGGAIRKMLYSESMYCTMTAAVKGGAFGILIPWLISLSLRNVFPVRFHLPICATILSAGIVFCAVLVITRIETEKMKGQSLIETIRMDSIR